MKHRQPTMEDFMEAILRNQHTLRIEREGDQYINH